VEKFEKFDKMPSSFRFDKITSPACRSFGNISQSGLLGSLIGANQTAGYDLGELGLT
jgi:hypothetical protein